MRRTVKLQVRVPTIEMCDPRVGPVEPWMPTPDDALVFEFEEGGLQGTISINADPEGTQVDWIAADR